MLYIELHYLLILLFRSIFLSLAYLLLIFLIFPNIFFTYEDIGVNRKSLSTKFGILLSPSNSIYLYSFCWEKALILNLDDFIFSGKFLV